MSSRQVGVVVGLLVAARIMVLIVTISLLPHEHEGHNLIDYDAARYHEIANEPGAPYRDFEVEVPPVELGAIEALDGPSPRTTAIRLGWAMFAVDLFIAAVLWIAWGRRATLTYLLLGLPMCLIVYFRLDLLSIALAVLAVALAQRNHERSGGALLAAAAMAKIWPLLLLPLWLVHRRWRALTWCAAALGLGTMGWVWWGGWSGPVQVLSFRHASGWQAQSVVGNLVDIVSKAPTAIEQGTLRVGFAPLWAKGLLLAGLVACSAFVWTRCWGRPELAAGLGSLCVLSALLVFSPLLSDQYVFWLFPWAAIAADGEERSLVVPVFLVGVATAAVGLVPYLVPLDLKAGAATALVFSRNALLLFLLIDSLRRLRHKGWGASNSDVLDQRRLLLPVEP